MRTPLYFILVITLLSSCASNEHQHLASTSEDYRIRLEIIADSTVIKTPSAITFLPGNKMLATDRSNGKILLLDLNKGNMITEIKNVPAVVSGNGAGIHDIIVHPGYDKSGWIYFSYTQKIKDSFNTLVVDRAKLKENSLLDIQRLFEVKPSHTELNHYGGRLLLNDGFLFITMGDRYYLRDSAQFLHNHLGKIFRINEDGSIPVDNPFRNVTGAMPEIWSYGHRNPQGLALNPVTNELWEHEHGPKGGDEVNIIKPGLNYGWPVICHGIDYDGKPIGEGIKEQEGMEQPLHSYTPSVAPSGMLFYTGNKFPAWKNNLFIGAMGLRHLNRLVVKGNKVIHEERIFKDLKKRVRCLAQDAEGHLYIGVDGGMILKLIPQDK